MAQYLLAVYPNQDKALSEKEFRQTCEDVGALVDELTAAGGTFVFGGGLNTTLPSTVIRSVDGEIVTTDGPFAETKEQLGGFWIIDVEDFETAKGWGAKFSALAGTLSRWPHSKVTTRPSITSSTTPSR